jgi:hypothetical protein
LSRADGGVGVELIDLPDRAPALIWRRRRVAYERDGHGLPVVAPAIRNRLHRCPIPGASDRAQFERVCEAMSLRHRARARASVGTSHEPARDDDSARHGDRELALGEDGVGRIHRAGADRRDLPSYGAPMPGTVVWAGAVVRIRGRGRRTRATGRGAGRSLAPSPAPSQDEAGEGGGGEADGSRPMPICARARSRSIKNAISRSVRHISGHPTPPAHLARSRSP